MKKKILVASVLGAAALAALAIGVPNLLRTRVSTAPAATPQLLPPASGPVASASGPVVQGAKPVGPAPASVRRPRAQQPADSSRPPVVANELEKAAGEARSALKSAPSGKTARGRREGDLALSVGFLPARQSLELKKDEQAFLASPHGFNREAYDHIAENPFLAVAVNPLSTFSIDVDTASYANVRRFLTSGQLPPKDAVRIEELVNYFRYDYPEPEGDAPFSISTEVGRCPWKPEHRLALIGLRGRSLDEESLPPRNLTFLLDVSGSMNSPDKLPLLKRAMGVLVDTLREEDRVAIVVYAGASGLVLPPTSGAAKGEIRAALDALRAGGSTAGGAGIELAYRVASENYVEGGINRVILATDGDFNVGISSEGDLVRLIEQKRESGVFLSVLGFGQGNLQDAKMEKLADHGNGNYSYIDSFREARKVLGTESGGTLVTIAKDVKIQVEFNPVRVKAYRLIGYENRALRAEDFADDRKDAGEIGAGHTVTALYELVPVGVDMELPAVDPLRYQRPAAVSSGSGAEELLTVKLRHKEPTGTRSRLTSVAVADVVTDVEASANLRFSAAVAAFGMLLRDSGHKGSASWAQVIDLARGAIGPDPEGHRAEFLALARNAQTLATMEQVAITR
jgi:Ca-activated chloride channel family protein